MDRKAVLDKARAWSVEHEMDMHAWASLRYQGDLYLGVYLHRGKGYVELQLIQQFGQGQYEDEVQMFAKCLNEARGLGEPGVQCLLDIFFAKVPRNDPVRGVTHLYPWPG